MFQARLSLTSPIHPSTAAGMWCWDREQSVRSQGAPSMGTPMTTRRLVSMSVPWEACPCLAQKPSMSQVRPISVRLWDACQVISAVHDIH